MNFIDLPYLPRPSLENELREFLRAPLALRANSTNALLLSGEKGVGKSTLVQHCLDHTPELQRYTILTLDLRDVTLHELEEHNHRLKEKGLDSIVEVAKESSPYLVKLLLAVLHIFTKDQIFNAPPRERFKDLRALEEFIFLLLEQQPVLLLIKNFERDNTEHTRSLAHFVNASYERKLAFTLVLLTDEPAAEAQETLKNLQRFLRSEGRIRELGLAPLTQQEVVAHFTACGLSSAWAETLHRFAEGHFRPLNSMWKLLQAQGILQNEGRGWVTRDEPRYILSRDFMRAQLRELVQRRQQGTAGEFEEPLIDALLLTAAMGETFLPQAVAETALPRKRGYSPKEIAAWEDLWYEVLEEQSEGTPALTVPVQEQGQNKTLIGAHDRRFFVYAFHDPHWQALLQYVAKQLCEPKQLDQTFYKSLLHLDEWLQACFQTNWEQALPYRIAVNRTLSQNDTARALEKLQRLQKLRVDLPLQISAERKRVAHGAAAGSLYQLLRWYCDVLEESGDYQEALEVMYEAHTLVVQQKIQLTELALAAHLNALGFCYYNCGESAEAEALYHRSLAAYEKQLGADHPHIATSLNNLAELLRAQGKYAEAEPFSRRSLAIDEKASGPDHPEIARDLNNLAGLLESQSKAAEAEPLYRRSLAIYEKQLGQDHPFVATSLNNLAGLLESQGKSAEAEPLYRRSLAIREEKLGPEHPNVATSLNNLALLLQSQGKYAEAEPLYRRSLAIQEEKLKRDHPQVAASLNNLAELLRAQGKYAEAEPLYRRSLAILEQQLGVEHPDVATSLNNLAQLLKVQSKYTEAELLFRRAEKICDTSLGPNHSNTQTVRANLALLLLRR